MGVVFSFVFTACAQGSNAPPNKMVPKNKPERQAEVEIAPEPEPEPDILDFSDDFDDDEDDWLDDSFSGLDDAFAEREQFMRDQQLASDGSLLVAVTDAQKAFVEAQRDHVIGQGGEFNEFDESIILALTSDACETAILNFHEVDQFVFESHVATSPLIQSLVHDSASDFDAATIERSLADIMVFGMKYMCPADAGDWRAVYHEIYG